MRSLGAVTVLAVVSIVASADAGAVANRATVDLLHPAWSPDGRQIAFTRSVAYQTDSEASEIWVVPARGGQARRLTTSGHAAAWSPDGRRIAFRTETEAVEPLTRSIVVMGRDGLRRRTVLSTTADTPWNHLSGPAWSPDGRRLAVVVGQDLVTVDLGTGRTTRERPAPPGAQPAWSSTDRLAVAGGRGIWVVGPAGFEWSYVSAVFESGYWWPAWSRRGARIAFLHSPSMTAAHWITVARADGSGRRALTRGEWPSWSADGRHVVFAAPSPRSYRLYTIRPESSGRKQLPFQLPETLRGELD